MRHYLPPNSPEPTTDIKSPLLRELSPCCDKPMHEAYGDVQCTVCRRVWKRPDPFAKERKAFER